MFKSINTYLILFLFVGVVSVGYLYKNALVDLGEANSKVESLVLEIDAANKRIEEERKKLANLEIEKENVQQTFRATKSELDKLKGRQATVKAKPVLVERKIQASFDTFMNNVQCDTGAIEKC
jgi:chromosome segregation ATPase